MQHYDGTTIFTYLTSQIYAAEKIGHESMEQISSCGIPPEVLSTTIRAQQRAFVRATSCDDLRDRLGHALIDKREIAVVIQDFCEGLRTCNEIESTVVKPDQLPDKLLAALTEIQ